ncbi:MAG TPA: right-handed parallel beta-helix repeat-containing protein [Solirubrobacterales bacterium]
MARYRFLSAAVAAAALLIAAASAQAKVIKVNPGGSIQAAVDEANPGDTVLVAPGTYTEAGRPCPAEPTNTCAVAISKDDISVVGQSGNAATLQAASGQDVGIGVAQTDDPSCLTDPTLRVHGSLLSGLTVQGFGDDGVLLFCVDGWRISDLVSRDNDEYSIFPSHSFNGRLDHSFASGAHDTGMYIGQSFNSRMDHNVATRNVSGYEIENSIGVTADYNVAFKNTGGILSFTLPFLDAKVNSGNVIEHNVVHHNNAPNECSGGTVCEVPSGTGILVLAADSNEVRENLVTGNKSFGIAVANICVAQQLPPDVCAALDIEPNPDDNRITFNTVLGNGTNPDPILPPMFAVDLAWDGTGTGNCWSNNVFNTFFPPPALPSC